MLGARDDLARHIGERELLLVLDNFEQVVEAGPAVADLVSSCPNLCLLVTSRERLRLRDELEYAVEPLPSDDAAALRRPLRPARGRDSDRALRARSTTFRWPSSSRPRAQMCCRRRRPSTASSGASTSSAAPATSTRASRRSVRPSSGATSSSTREEQRLFARLAVFAGGCTLEAAEGVTDAELDVLESLVQKSLVRHAGERFWMLETIRDYGLERLDESAEADALRRRHAEWFLALAERAEPHLEGAGQAEWLGRLEEDVANIREISGQPDLAGRFLVALRFFWAKRGYVAEGRRAVEDLLPRLSDDDPALRMALVTGSLLAVMQGDFDAAIAHGERATELGEAAGDVRPGLEVASALGRALLSVGEEERALALFTDAAERGPGFGRPGIAAIALLNLGYVALLRGELEVADDYLRRAVDLAASCGELHAQSRSLAARSSVALEGGRLEDARGLALQSLAIAAPTHDATTPAGRSSSPAAPWPPPIPTGPPVCSAPQTSYARCSEAT